MKALKIIGIGVLALVALLAALVAQAFYRFDLAFNPVASPIREHAGLWGEMTALTPKPFSVGQDSADVLRILAQAGFSRTPDTDVWRPYAFEIAAGKQLFQREADSFPCNIQLYVFVKFSVEDRLASAKGTQHEHGCL